MNNINNSSLFVSGMYRKHESCLWNEMDYVTSWLSAFYMIIFIYVYECRGEFKNNLVVNWIVVACWCVLDNQWVSPLLEWSVMVTTTPTRLFKRCFSYVQFFLLLLNWGVHFFHRKFSCAGHDLRSPISLWSVIRWMHCIKLYFVCYTCGWLLCFVCMPIVFVLSFGFLRELQLLSYNS